MKTPICGHIPGVPVGAEFPSRAAVKAAGLHRELMAGISYLPGSGAEAIVISGGYEDDTDQGDEIVYTGHGGNDAQTRRQVGDQRLHRGNLALARSCLEGLPVRLIRGARSAGPYAPNMGYRYDGLYYVDAFWRDLGRSGYTIWRFHLVACDNDTNIAQGRALAEENVNYTVAPRRQATIQRIVRTTIMAAQVKELHDYSCQICDLRLETLAGPYAEGAHIWPLGAPHNGPDVQGNILCVCPNCHVRLDYGAIVIDADLTIRDATTHVPVGRLHTNERHQIDPDCLSYHRRLFSRPSADREG